MHECCMDQEALFKIIFIFENDNKDSLIRRSVPENDFFFVFWLKMTSLELKHN